MNEEIALHQAVVAQPQEDVPRLIFADWLEERGDRRADFLRLECELNRLAAGDPRAARLQQELADGFGSLDTEWVASVSRAPIFGCSQDGAEQRCPHRHWEQLLPTQESRSRNCDVCQEQVWFVQTIEEAREAIHVYSQSVALDPRIVRRAGDLEPSEEILHIYDEMAHAEDNHNEDFYWPELTIVLPEVDLQAGDHDANELDAELERLGLGGVVARGLLRDESGYFITVGGRNTDSVIQVIRAVLRRLNAPPLTRIRGSSGEWELYE